MDTFAYQQMTKTPLCNAPLESAGCELIFEGKASGKKAERQGLKKVLHMFSRDEALVV